MLIPKEGETLYISGKRQHVSIFLRPRVGPGFWEVAVPKKELLKGAGRIGEPRGAMDEPHP